MSDLRFGDVLIHKGGSISASIDAFIVAVVVVVVVVV